MIDITGIAAGTVALSVTGGLVAWLLGTAARRLPQETDDVVEAISSVLPQTQCAQCGYPGCRPYAEAVAAGEAINRCPPGGDETIIVLADLLGRERLPLDDQCGEAKPKAVARIREAECIGCTLCIQACPVDAILGTAQAMHTIIERECTGCELCLPPCPVDCIDLVTIETPEAETAAALTASIETECIRCGLCEPECPRDLSPVNLYWHRDTPARQGDLELARCIECQRCDRVCPSQLPLTEIFRQSKRTAHQLESQRSAAEHAERRFEQRNRRLASVNQKVKQRPSANEAASLLDSLKRERP